jgi:hypothetical protein
MELTPVFSSAQQSSNDEVIKLMNEQSLRELHEKHDTEQRPSVHSISNPSVIASSGIAAPLIQMPSLDNSKIHMRTLYPLRGGKFSLLMNILYF